MKVLFEKWWDNNSKSFGVRNYKKVWKENGIKPKISYHTNKAQRILGHKCFDATLTIGYTIFNYTNWDLQNEWSGTTVPDKKLTDNEIIKALECCIGDTDGKDCFGCPLYEIDDCQAHLNLAALDLINRQKAEIERLTAERNAMHQDVKAAEEYAWQLKTEKENIIRTYAECQAEAYKEFAERLKDKHRRITDYDEAGFGAQIFIVEERVIDNLLKEMVGDNQ